MTPGHCRKRPYWFWTPPAPQTGKRRGMQLLDDHLFELYRDGVIEDEMALALAQRTQEMKDKVLG